MVALAGGLVVLGGEPLTADKRSTEVLRYECRSHLGRRDVTLFANGTVRQRLGPLDAQELYLDELRTEELASYLARLEEILAGAESEPELAPNVPQGSWVDECSLRLALPDTEPVTWSFSVLEIPPLVVAQLIHVADDLADYTRLPERAERLPGDYHPRPGDVLRTAEGGRFRVVDLTADERAVELENLDAPISIFVAVDELSEVFKALEEPGGR